MGIAGDQLLSTIDIIGRFREGLIDPAVVEVQAVTLFERLRTLNRETQEILREARDSKNHVIALQAIGRAEKQLELEARLLGQLDDSAKIAIGVQVVSSIFDVSHLTPEQLLAQQRVLREAKAKIAAIEAGKLALFSSGGHPVGNAVPVRCSCAAGTRRLWIRRTGTEVQLAEQVDSVRRILVPRDLDASFAVFERDLQSLIGIPKPPSPPTVPWHLLTLFNREKP